MALSEAEKTDVRRYCGYPVLGSNLNAPGWHLFQSRGLLEYRLNNLSGSEESVLRRHIGTLIVLENAIPKSGEHLDTDQAAVWSRNRTEPEDRARLFDGWRRRLCTYLGVPPGPGLPKDGSLAIVV